jgi:hypothetical protein
MKEMTIFVADDGTRFDTAKAAIDYERLCVRCRELEAMLGPHPQDSGERIKHPRLAAYRKAVIALCRELFPREPIFQHDAATIHHFSYAGRFLSEQAPRPVNHLWHRLMCVGDDGYEYEQPFFALHPDEFVKQVRV